MSLTSPPKTEEASAPRSVTGMSTKPPSGSGLAAVEPHQGVSEDPPPSPTSTNAQPSRDSIEDAIGDILLDVAEEPVSDSLGGPQVSLEVAISVNTPEPVSLETPEPVVIETPAPVSPVSFSTEPISMRTPQPARSLFATTPPPVTETPPPLSIKTPTPTPMPLVAAGPASPEAAVVPEKTPAPLTARDPSSALPSIPPAKKEPSGAFPLPGMAPPEAPKESDKTADEDATFIARPSLLDDVVEESTKVEPLETALRAAASKEEPIALSDQALVERGKALGVPAEDRVAAAQLEEPGNDDDFTVSATPGIISVS